VEPDYINKTFIPLALDSYFRGNSQELAYCKQVGSGGNHVVVATAGGMSLAEGGTLSFLEKDLAPVVAKFRELPEAVRKPVLEDPAAATPPERPVPAPPANGLILRGYCTYLQRGPDGAISRNPQFYYKQNPDAWAAETQNDMLWLTEAEWKSLIPEVPTPGETLRVLAPVQHRFFSTIGIDYMEGSVNALPVRASDLTIRIDSVNADQITMHLEGEGHMGTALEGHQRDEPSSRGCTVRVLGKLAFDRRANAFTRFDLVGVGQAWGNKMEYTKREIHLDEYPWTYGIACELVTGRGPMDLIPPYNLIHYGSGLAYFPKP
jgi:hypothetical protein